MVCAFVCHVCDPEKTVKSIEMPSRGLTHVCIR